MKKLVITLLVGCLLCGCSNSDSASSLTSDEVAVKEAIKSGYNNLNSKESYSISRMLEDAIATEYNMLIKDNGTYFSCLSVSDDEPLGSQEYGSEDVIEYGMTYYLNSDDKSYIFIGDDTYEMSQSYSDYIKDRHTLFVSSILDKCHDFKEEDNFSLDVFGESVQFKCYSCVLPAEYARKYLAAEQYARYESIDNPTGKFKELVDYYTNQLDRSSTCSDAQLYFGVDIDGVLRYSMFTAGGLGQTMYIANVVLGYENLLEDMQTPDLTVAKPYNDYFADTVEFSSQYDTIEDAIAAYADMDTFSSTEESTEQQIESETANENDDIE